jgi:hypothetical protein
MDAGGRDTGSVILRRYRVNQQGSVDALLIFDDTIAGMVPRAARLGAPC